MVEFHDQPFLVVVEKRLVSMIVEYHFRRRRKLERLTGVRLTTHTVTYITIAEGHSKQRMPCSRIRIITTLIC